MSRYPLLSALAPTFSADLAQALEADGEAGLAAQVSTLRVLSICGCNEMECASFTVREMPRGVPQVETVPLDGLDGLVNVDVASGRIVHVEVLYRRDLRDALRAGLRSASEN